MFVSRLRLRLAASFALALLLGLTLVDVALFLFLGSQGDSRLSQEVVAAATGLRDAVQREHGENPDDPVSASAREALAEWPAGPEAVVIRTADGVILARRGPDSLVVMASGLSPLPGDATVDRRFDDEGDARIAVAEERGTGVTVAAARSTASLREDKEALALWLLLSVPVVLLVALPGGYVLAGRVLRPFRLLAADIESMRPGALERRLPVNAPPDEIDLLAVEVNHLLERLDLAQQQSRRFLAHAAHQLRTPLTLIRGESELASQRDRSPEDFAAALRRISQAASQMSRRVDDLFLLVRAEAREQITARAPVELDAVAIDAVDMMRGRATLLQRELALGTMEEVEVAGEEGLLREAALELVENACRHAAPGTIIVSVRRQDTLGVLEVSSVGDQDPVGPNPTGLGLSIVQWIATAHGGRLVRNHQEDRNSFMLVLPLHTPA